MKSDMLDAATVGHRLDLVITTGQQQALQLGILAIYHDRNHKCE